MKRKHLLFICPSFGDQSNTRSPVFTNNAVYQLQAYLESLPDINDNYELSRVYLQLQPVSGLEDTFRDVFHHCQRVLRKEPDILAFSLYCWNVSLLNDLAGALKQMAPEVLMIAGGPEVYERKSFCQQFTSFDVLVEGDGELPLQAVLERLASSHHLGNIPNVSHRKHGRWIHNPSRHNAFDINNIPNYYKNLREELEGSGSYLTARGCSHNCDYCLWARQSLCVKKSEKIIEELHSLIDGTHLEQLTFFDYDLLEIHGKDLSWLRDVSDIIRRQERGFTTSFFINGNQLGNPVLAEVMELLSTRRVLVGLQTGSDDVARSVNRGWTTAPWKELAAIEYRLRTRFTIELVYPLPGENPGDFLATVQRLYRLGYYRFHIFTLMVLRGSRLRRNARRQGLEYLERPPYFCYQTPSSPRDATLKMTALGNIITNLGEALWNLADEHSLQDYFASEHAFLDRLQQAIDEGMPVAEIVAGELERISGTPQPLQSEALPVESNATEPPTPPAYQPLVVASPQVKPGMLVSIMLAGDDEELTGDEEQVELKKWSRLLTSRLLSHAHPPRQVDAFLAAGLHLRLHDRQGDKLHLKLTPAETTPTAWWRSPVTAVTIVKTKKYIADLHVSWLKDIVAAITPSVEDSDDWPGFLRRAAATSEESASSLSQALLRVTSHCNASCPFCNADGLAPDRCEGLDNVTRRLQELRQSGWQSVAFTGGEPTLLPELPQMIAAAKQLGFSSVTVQTNGILLDDDERVRQLAAVGLDGTLISIHAADPALHDDIVGIAGAHRHTLAAAEKLVANDIRADVSFVMTSRNFSQLEAVVDMLLRQLGCRMTSLVASYCGPEGRALENLDWLPRLGEIRQPLRRALETALSSHLEMVIPGQCGLPMCQLPEYLDYFDEYHHPRAAYMPTKTRPQVCSSCALANRCSGFWSVYFERFGTSELMPLQQPALTERAGG